MTVLPSKKMVERIQARVKGGFFVDTASIIYRSAPVLDAYGQPTYTEASVSMACSFTDKPSKESWSGYADIENVEAEIRFVGTMPSKGDKVILTRRFNRTNADEQDYTSMQFEIVGIRDRDAFGYVCALKKVEL